MRCDPCDALGRAYAWLEVQISQSTQVQAHPRGGVASFHDGIDDPADFDQVSASSRIPLLEDSGWIDPVATDLGPNLSVQLAPRTDRVLAQRIQRFESAVHVFQYATGLGKGVVRVTGQPLAVLPDSDWRPLRRRAIAGIATGVALAFVGLMVMGAYVGQAVWFQEHGNGGAIGLLGLVAGVFGALAVLGLLVPKSAWSLLRCKLPILAFAASGLAIVGLWNSNGPSLRSVESAIEAGELSSARLELAAVQAIGDEAEDTAKLAARLDAAAAADVQRAHEREDEQHLARVVDSADVESGLAALQGQWHDRQLAENGRTALLELASREVDAAVAAKEAGELARLVRVVGPLDKGLGQLAAERGLLAVADDCIEANDFDCAAKTLAGWKAAEGDEAGQPLHDALITKLVGQLATSIEAASVDDKDLGRRLSSLDATLADARLYEQVTGKGAPRSVKSLDKARTKTSAALDKQRNKVAATEARQRKTTERKARRAAAKSAASQRRTAARADRVSCCDGSSSPSCRYSQGSLRGCCSHHGGVC